MLYMTFSKDGVKSIYKWHFGEKHPCPLLDDIEIANIPVVTVQADGDELGHIIGVFHNIPSHVVKPVQRWTGDDARFIILNLI